MCRANSYTAVGLPIALFGIDNSGIGVAANLLVIFLVALWLALVFWTYADARRRLTDSVLIGSATIAALIFPFAGSLVYAIVRPPETLDDAYERELDVRAAELRVRLLESAVKGGPGSSAHNAALGAEASGEPQGRTAQPSGQGRTAQPPGQGRPSGQPKSATKAPPSGAPRRSPEPGSTPAAPQRSAQPRRSPSGGGSRPPAGGS